METNFNVSLNDHAGFGIEDEADECRQRGYKKKRLSSQQVRSLERSFEIENKLEPDRKFQIAHELGLQPRQVAIWFQNRRARWKTKQLERDYGILKLNFDTLKSDFDSLHKENQKLHAQLCSLKEKLKESQEQMKDGGSSKNLVGAENGRGSESQENANVDAHASGEMYDSEGSSGILNDQYCEMNNSNNKSMSASYSDPFERQQEFMEEPCNLFNMVDDPSAAAFHWWEWS